MRNIKYFVTTIVAVVFFSLSFAACNEENSALMNTQNNNNDTTSKKMKITIGSVVFTSTLNDNATATVFKGMLPLTISMIELNGNEKYYDLSTNLPVRASNPGTIQTGDLMIYGSNTLVLFYKTFSTSYAYTGLGHIDNTSGLAAALGSGNVTVKFEIE